MDTTMISKGKVTLGTKVGYAFGAAGDSIPYNLFFTYFLFFLTTSMGIDPVVAGIISFIGVAWDAITDPVMGYISDNTTSKYGRRRPYMALSIIPMTIILGIMFAQLNLTGGLQSAFYIIVSILLWTFFTTWCVPWVALGAELSQDYNERNNIRMWVGLFSYPLLALCNAGPMKIQAMLLPKGYTIEQCWEITGIIAAVLFFVLATIAWRVTRGQEIINPEALIQQKENKKEARTNIFKSYKEVLSIKAYRILLYSGIIFIFGFMLFQSLGVFLLSYNAGLGPAQQAMFWLLYSAISMIVTPIVIKLANKFGKKQVYITLSLLNIVNGLAFFIYGIHSFTSLMIFSTFFTFCSGAFWGLYVTLTFDISEIDEFVNGKRREGSIISLAQLFQKLGGAIAMSVAGFALKFIGFTGFGPQSPETIHGILVLTTIVPGIIYAISGLIFIKYPITRQNFEALKEAIQLKRNGQEYSTEGFKELL